MFAAGNHVSQGVIWQTGEGCTAAAALHDRCNYPASVHVFVTVQTSCWVALHGSGQSQQAVQSLCSTAGVQVGPLLDCMQCMQLRPHLLSRRKASLLALASRSSALHAPTAAAATPTSHWPHCWLQPSGLCPTWFTVHNCLPTDLLACAGFSPSGSLS